MKHTDERQQKNKEYNTIYGISPIVKHPQGFSYICAYLTPKKTLSCSLMLAAWDTKTGKIIKIEGDESE